jgi:hypothetical protein
MPPNRDVTHRVEVHSSSGDLLAILDKARNLSYGQRLNDGSTFTFLLDFNDPKATSAILPGS